jgi:uncharacterized membrane protein YdcZ (DUF606 family)
MTHGNYPFWLAIILIGLIVSSLFAETYGWFGLDKMPLRLSRLLGVLLCILGVLLALMR